MDFVFQLRDTIPLLKISLHKQKVSMSETGTAIFLDFCTVSSFAWSAMLRSALEGRDRLRLYPLEPWLTRELRQNLVGGPSFCVNRLIERGQPIPPIRLTGHPKELDGLAEQEMAYKTMTYDCNGFGYF